MEEYSLSYSKEYLTRDIESIGGSYDTNYYSTDKSGRRWDIGIYFNTVVTSDKETNPEVSLDLYIRLDYDQIDLSWEDGDTVEYGSAWYPTPGGYIADFDFRDLNIEYDLLDVDTEKPMDITVVTDLLGVSEESLNAFILDLAKKTYEHYEDWIIEVAIDNVKNSYDDYYESFDSAFEALNSLNEVFTYKEEDILSDEEIKEITAKVAELEPQYKEASKKHRAKRKELKAASMNWQEIDKDPEYKKLDDILSTLWNQLSPLKRKLDKHNAIIRYQTNGDQIATEDDWDGIANCYWDVEVEVDVEVYEEADEYPSGWDYGTDSISWSTIPARRGILHYWTTTLDITEETVADFLGKKVEEVTVKDLMDFDEESFEEYLAEKDEVIKKAQKEAENAVWKGDYNESQVDWEDDSWDY